MTDYYQELADAVGITREQAKKVYMYQAYMGKPKEHTWPLTYFIGGNWQIGKMRDGKWKLGSTPDDDVHVYGGSHAGVKTTKQFATKELRNTFLGRMVQIYADRFYFWNGGKFIQSNFAVGRER